MAVSVPTQADFDALTARVVKLEQAVFPPPPTVPGDLTGIQASRIADLLEIWGPNCFPNGQDGAGASASASAYIKGLSSICGGSGMGPYCRLYGGPDASFIQAVCNGVPGTRFVSAVSWDPAGSLANILAMISNPALKGLLVAVEGINEPNNGGVQIAGQPLPVATCLSVQQQLYAAAHPAGIITLLPSVIDTGSNTYLTDYMGTSLPAFIAACDRANGHDYPNSGNPANDMARRTSYLTSVTGKPSDISEFNSLLYNDQPKPDDQKTAYYMVDGWLVAFQTYGAKGFNWYSMYDYKNPPMAVGLFNNYDPTNPSLAALCAQALFQLCKDTSGAARHTFQPGKLQLNVTPALPATAHLLVCQSLSTGEFQILIGNSGDQPGGPITNYTLTASGPRKRWREYWITSTPAQAQTVRQDKANAATFTIGLGNEDKLIVVDY